MYDPCSPLAIVTSPGTLPEEVASIEAAVAAWAQVIPVDVWVDSQAQAEPALPIEFESGETFYRAIYWDAIGAISVSRDRLAPEDYAIAVAHELGHAFGLPHVPAGERPSVMNTGNLEVPPTEADGAEVAVVWEACRVSAPRPEQ